MLKVKIETENDAFKDAFSGRLEGEVCRCLSNVILCIRCGKYESDIFDINGNSVGHFKLTKK